MLPSPLLPCSRTQQLSSSRHLGCTGATGTSPFVSPCNGGLGEMHKSLRLDTLRQPKSTAESSDGCLLRKDTAGARSKQDQKALLGDETAQHVLSTLQPSPCCLSSLTCAIPPWDKPSQDHNSRDLATHVHKPGRLWHTRCFKNPSGGGDGGGKTGEQDGSECLEVSPCG